MAEDAEHASGTETGGDDDAFIPCEFCDQLFYGSKLMQHQSGCQYEQNEQNRNTHQVPWFIGQRAPKNENEVIQGSAIKIEQIDVHDTYAIKEKDTGGYVMTKIDTPKVEDTVSDVKDTGGYVMTKIDTTKVDDSVSDVKDERQCDLCELYVPSNNMDKHFETCEKFPYECFKCEWIVLRCDREAHNVICTGQHGAQGDLGVKGVAKNSGEREQNIFPEQDISSSSAYDAVPFDLLDDNNPENETVEQFMWKAFRMAESLKKATLKHGKR